MWADDSEYVISRPQHGTPQCSEMAIHVDEARREAFIANLALHEVCFAETTLAQKLDHLVLVHGLAVLISHAAQPASATGWGFTV